MVRGQGQAVMARFRTEPHGLTEGLHDACNDYVPRRRSGRDVLGRMMETFGRAVWLGPKPCHNGK